LYGAACKEPALTWGLLFGLLTAAAWSTLDALRKRLSGRLSPELLALALTLGPAPLFITLAAWQGVVPQEPVHLAIAGACGLLYAAANILFFWALRLSPLSATVPMLALTPALTALVAGLLLGERLSFAGGVGIAAVVIGAVFLMFERGEGRSKLRRGSALMVGVAALFAVAAPLDKVGLRFASVGFHSATVTLVAGTIIGAYALRPSRAGALGREPEGGRPRGRSEVGWVIAAVVVMAIAHVTQLVAIQSLPVSLVESLKRGIGMSMAVVVGRVFFAEPITASKVAALVLMLGGALVVLFA